MRSSSWSTIPLTAFIGCPTSLKPTPGSPAPITGVAAKVNSADKLYLVIESVKPDAKHDRSSIAPIAADGAEKIIVIAGFE